MKTFCIHINSYHTNIIAILCIHRCHTRYVETLKDERRVYLRRPANLHNGFDFIVCVENTNFNPSGRKRNYPTHDDIINDLIEKFTNNPSDYEILYPILKSVHDCQPIANYDLKNMNFKTGFPCDLIIKVLKWLFIEQYSLLELFWKRYAVEWNSIHK